jgi:alkylhydroperoxidase family enzyme
MTRQPERMIDEDVAALRKHFDEGEVVEIAVVVGLFNYFNRFNDALGMEPTKPGEGLGT